ncbi:MAG: glycosyltransferase family 2 protein [Cellvibrio sp.]|nr:glycosyltransferase family 2 protein [Cellvibrio sp.]
MTNNIIDFSVIIPCKNEIKYIDQVIESVFAQDAFIDCSGEVFIIDGGSSDGTAERVAFFCANRRNLILLENQFGTVSPALNIGIDASSGRYIIRMDVHAHYPPNYISSLIHHMEKNPCTDNVGYAIDTTPPNDSIKAHSIAHILSHQYGIGSALFRLRITSPQVVDTVPFGCFRREIFERLGKFDTELIRNQDDEFNGRIVNANGRIILLPDMRVIYFPRETYSKLWAMYYQYGMFKPLVLAKLRRPTTVRQLVPPLFVAGLLLLIFLSILGLSYSIVTLFMVVFLYILISIFTTKGPFSTCIF